MVTRLKEAQTLLCRRFFSTIYCTNIFLINMQRVIWVCIKFYSALLSQQVLSKLAAVQTQLLSHIPSDPNVFCFNIFDGARIR